MAADKKDIGPSGALAEPGTLALAAFVNLKQADDAMHGIMARWPEDTDFDPVKCKEHLLLARRAAAVALESLHELERLAAR